MFECSLCHTEVTIVTLGAPICGRCSASLQAKAALVEELVTALSELLKFATFGSCPSKDAARKRAGAAIAKAEALGVKP